MSKPSIPEDELITQIITRYNQFRILRQGQQEALDNVMPEAREMVRQYAAKARLGEARHWDEHIIGAPRKITVDDAARERIKQLKKGQV